MHALVSRIGRPSTFGLVAALMAMAGGLTAQQCPDGRAYAVELAEEGVTQEITLEGGATYLGRVVGAGDPVRFELLSGDVLEIARGRIICLRPVEGQRRNGAFWPADPNTTRLFFGPTGRALPSGEGYISVFELFMPFVAVGAGDRLTLSAGFPLFIAGGGIEVFWLAPKLEVVRTAGFRGALGVLAFFAPQETGSVGVLYGVGTFGETTDRALTVGAGWAYSTEDRIYEAPALMVGFETRVARRVKLISENYLLLDEGVGVLSFGPRFFGESLSADLGLALPFGQDEFFLFPLINFVWNW